MGSQKMNIKAITFLLLINLLLTMTLGCVSNTEQNPVEVADEPLLAVAHGTSLVLNEEKLLKLISNE